jgi:predicted DNA-binding transcriptional regulator AlpA
MKQEVRVKPMLTKSEVAAMLKVSVRTVDNYRRLGIIPEPMRVGDRLLRWSADEMEAFGSRVSTRPVVASSPRGAVRSRGRPRKYPEL